MTSQKLRATQGFAALLAITLSLGLTAPASADHGPASPGGPYDGYATGSAVHLDAVSNSSTRVLDVEVGVSNAAVDSRGLEKSLSEYRRTIVPAGLGEDHSRGHSTILEVGALLSPPEAENQVKPFVAEHNAPGSDRIDKSVVDQTVGPALHVNLLRNVAEANWNADTCVLGSPIALGEQHIARAELVETGDDASTGASEGFDKPIVAVDADAAGPRRAATHTASVQQLFAAGENRFGLQSASVSTLAPVTFLQGTPNEFTIEVDGSSFLSASADGRKGGAQLSFSIPLVTMIQNGDATKILPGAPMTVRVPATGDAIAEINVGVLASKKESANGTHADGVANVVEVKLLDLASRDLRGATVALGHMEVDATVPADGITCPIPVTKVADPESVAVGDDFATTITVTNPYDCPLEDVTLSDAIKVKQGALFTIANSGGAESFTKGASLSKGAATWDLGTIKPHSKKKVVITTTAQGAPGRILDTATARGSLANCKVGKADGGAGANVMAMAAVRVPVNGSGSAAMSASQVLGERQTLPVTGVGSTIVFGFLLLLTATFAGSTLRRSRA